MPKTVSFASPYEAEAEQLARRQAIATALQQGAMTPIKSQTAGGFVVPISPFEGLAKLGQALIAKNTQSKLDDESKALKDRYKTDSESVYAKALQEMQDQQGIMESQGQGPLDIPAKKGDPIRAAAILASSPNPAHQQMAQQILLQAQQSKLKEAERAETRDYDYRKHQEALDLRRELNAENNALRRDLLSANPKPPKDHRWNTSGELEIIPGSQTDRKEKILRQKQQVAAETGKTKADMVIAKVDEALNQSGFFSTGFTGSVLGKIPGTSAYDLDRTIDTIKANVGFEELQAMRQASPTGGALGQVAVQELNMLQAVLGSLERGQSHNQLVSNLKKVRQHFENWKKIMAQAQADGDQSGDTPLIPNNLSAADVEALRAGQKPSLDQIFGGR